MRLVWTPPQFAALTAAEVIVYGIESMAKDRIVMESVDEEAANPLLVVAAHPHAFRRAEHEAMRKWGPHAGRRIAARVRDMVLAGKVGPELVIPIRESMSAAMVDGGPFTTAAQRVWRIAL